MSNTDFEWSPVTQADYGAIQANGFGMVNLGARDDQQVVIFRWESIQDQARSREAGRPIYTRHQYVMIHPPGERLNIIDRPVQESDKQRWPRQWQAFIQNRAFVPEGTPIAQLFPANPEVADMLRGLGIHTVEMCAKMTAHAIESVGMGCQDWVNKAKTYLESAQRGVDYHKIEQMEADHRHEVNALKNQIADLVARVNSMQSAQAALPGYAQAQMGYLPGSVQKVDLPVPIPEQWAAPPAGFVDDSEPAAESPKRKGWPKGKPRKPAQE